MKTYSIQLNGEYWKQVKEHTPGHAIAKARRWWPDAMVTRCRWESKLYGQGPLCWIEYPVQKGQKLVREPQSDGAQETVFPFFETEALSQ